MALYKNYYKLILLAPALIVLVVLTVYPLFNLIRFSLYEYLYIEGTQNYVGLKNYKEILNDRFFLIGLRNTLEFVISTVFLELLIGLGFALLFTTRFKGKKYLLPIMVLPMLLSTMVICAVWKTFYHYDYGLINYILRSLGLGKVEWLTNRKIVMKSIVIVNVWQWTPLSFLILLAGLQSIPKELYEAARVDGARESQIFRHITLHLLKPYMVLAILLRTLDSFRLFPKVYALTGGGPGTATETIAYYIYREGFKYFHLGRTSAAGVVMLLFVMAISAVYIRYIIGEQVR